MMMTIAAADDDDNGNEEESFDDGDDYKPLPVHVLVFPYGAAEKRTLEKCLQLVVRGENLQGRGNLHTWVIFTIVHANVNVANCRRMSQCTLFQCGGRLALKCSKV